MAFLLSAVGQHEDDRLNLTTAVFFAYLFGFAEKVLTTIKPILATKHALNCSINKTSYDGGNLD